MNKVVFSTSKKQVCSPIRTENTILWANDWAFSASLFRRKKELFAKRIDLHKIKRRFGSIKTPFYFAETAFWRNKTAFYFKVLMKGLFLKVFQ